MDVNLELALYKGWEKAYRDTIYAMLPLGFFSDFLGELLEGFCERSEEVPRVLELDSLSSKLFHGELELYVFQVQPLLMDLAVLWVDVYNCPDLFKYFSTVEFGSPLGWTLPRFRPFIRPELKEELSEFTLAVLERYCLALVRVLDFFEVFSFKESWLEDMGLRVYDRLSGYLEVQDYVFKLRSFSDLSDSYFRDQEYLFRASLQISNAGFRVFPADVIFIRDVLRKSLDMVSDCRSGLFTGFQGMARKTAKKLYFKLCKFIPLTEDDLYQEACRGLLHALERFRYRKGASFGAYADRWLKQACRSYVSLFAGTARLPSHQSQVWYTVRTYKREFFDVHNRFPSISEISDKFGLSSKMIRSMEQMSVRAVSLDAKLSSDDENFSLVSTLVDETPSNQPVMVSMRGDLRNLFEDLMSRLKPKHREVLKLVFGWQGPPMSFRDLATTLDGGMSTEGVRQRCFTAVEKLLGVCSREERERLSEFLDFKPERFLG